MAAIAPIVLNDGLPTPVARTFSPVSKDASGVAKFTDRSGGISIGFPVMTLSMRSPSKTSRNYRVVGKIVVPTLEVTAPSTASGIQPAPTVAYPTLGSFEFVLPERGTTQERKNVLAFIRNALANAHVTNMVETFESIYGG